MAELPSGAVTFLFTDIEGSTQLVKQLRDRYPKVLAEHQRILREAFDEHGGHEIDTQGDAFFVAFANARDAVLAAVDAQRVLARHSWPEGTHLKVRIGVHTGQASPVDGAYTGVAVHRAARISAAGHGGQILVSQTTHNLLEDEEEDISGIDLLDLGEHRLKDLDRSVRLYQVQARELEREFPPPRTAAPGPAAEPAQPYYRRRTILIGALAGVLAAAVAIPIFALGSGGGEATVEASGDALGVIDAASGDLAASVSLPSGPTAVAPGFGRVWAASADANAVYAVDPETETVRDTIAVEDAPAGIATGAGSVWVTNSLSGTVSRIDPRTFEVVQTIPVGNGPTGIAVASGRVWVANTGDHSVSVLRAADGAPLKTFSVGSEPGAIALAGGSVWVTSSSWGEVVKLNPETGAVLDRVAVGDGPAALAGGSGSVWVANSLSGTVSRIDAQTDDVTSTIEVGPSADGVAVVGDAVWVGSESARAMTRIDRGGKTSLSVGSRPTAAAASGEHVYVALRSGEASHRGGTLRYVIPTGPGIKTADPANAYAVELWQVMALAHDGLVTYRRVAGQEGLQLVPDLAVALPTVSEDGKTYTFQLRSGIRYSNGALVKPSDVRNSLERVFTLRPRPEPAAVGFFQAIRGAKECTPKRCDLAKGVVADDAGGTVTFHLAAQDPDFLIKLASTFASVVPAGTPAVMASKEGLPGTGPYRIARLVKDRSIRLVRNRRFRQWSNAAQPAGLPDEIVLRAEPSQERRIALVTAGQGDITSSVPEQGFPVPPTYAAQLHLHSLPWTVYLALDTTRPPFGDARVRRALNYAIDRQKATGLVPGGSLRRPACQVFPPNFPGYRRYCPYTLDPGKDGAWSAPDMTKALQLVSASGTAGSTVTLWFPEAEAGTLGRYAAGVLRSLGYRVQTRSFDDITGYFAQLQRAKRPPDVAFAAWAADYPAASNFIKLLLNCGSPFNLAHFCDPGYDRRIGRALNLQPRDPAGANAAWAALDRHVVDLALWAPLFNVYGADLVSRRVGNYQYNPAIGPLLDQLWVR